MVCALAEGATRIVGLQRDPSTQKQGIRQFDICIDRPFRTDRGFLQGLRKHTALAPWRARLSAPPDSIEWPG